MLEVVLHWYAFGEVYAIFLVWLVTPLAYLALFFYLNRRLGLVENESSTDEIDTHGTN